MQKTTKQKSLKTRNQPFADFYISSDKHIEVVFAYCNLQGLSKNQNFQLMLNFKEIENNLLAYKR